MEITVKNFRGVADASLQLAPLALVCGRNHSGKSSIAQAVSAALTGNAAVIDGITKSAAGKLLRDGAKRGSCTVSDDAGSVTANWPGASISTAGNAPYASPMACGFVSVAEMKAKDAAAILISTIQALPTRQDFDDALAGLDAARLDAAWKSIADKGWDATHKRAQEIGSELKGIWQHITGEAYGHGKAETWRPACLDDIDTSRLEADLAKSREAHDRAKASQAVGEAEKKQLEAAVREGAEAQIAIAELQRVLDNGNAAVERITAELNALPRPEVLEQLAECPHCKGHLVVVSRTEVRAPTPSITPEENNARQAAIAEKQHAMSAARNTVTSAQANISQHRAAAAAGDRAADKLAALPVDGVASDVIHALALEIKEIERLISARDSIEEAAKKHQQIQKNQTLLDVLAPNGLRQQVLASRLGSFNAALGKICDAASWARVFVEPDMSITFGGRPYLLLSESEKFRARVTLQLALADLDASDVVVIDAADILDRAGRNGLFAALKLCELKAVVCMTMNRAEDVPPIGKAGIGRAYWLDDSSLHNLT